MGNVAWFALSIEAGTGHAFLGEYCGPPHRSWHLPDRTLIYSQAQEPNKRIVVEGSKIVAIYPRRPGTGGTPVLAGN